MRHCQPSWLPLRAWGISFRVEVGELGAFLASRFLWGDCASHMSWEPSVRTRHLTVIISLILIATATLLCFNIARLLNAHTAAKRESFEKVADPLSSFAQRAILNRPIEEPRLAIGLDETVR